MNHEITLDRAISHMQAGRLHEAGHCCLEVLGTQPNHPRALHLLGIVAHQSGRHDDAVTLLQLAIANQGDVPEAHNNLGNAYKALGRLEEAQLSYDRALELKPDYANARNNLGTVLQALGRHGDAIVHFEQALAQLGPVPPILYNLGNAYLELGRSDEAITNYRHALRLAPQFPDALTNLGRALASQGKTDEAMEQMAMALKIKPDHVDALVNLGLALSDSGERDEAIRHFRAALDHQPDHVVANHGLGVALQKLNRLEEAAECYRRTLELDPKHYTAMNNLGVALLEQKQLDQAALWFEKAIATAPVHDSALAWNNLGVARQNQNSIEESARCYRQALSINPNYHEALNNLGVSFHKKGQFYEAIEKFMKVQEMAPDYPDAYYNEGMARLAVGEFKRGWLQSEWRLQMETYKLKGHSEPLTDKALARGRTILIHCEQGLGDSIQFIRYAVMVQELGAKVIVFAPTVLVRLFGSVMGIDLVTDDVGKVPVCDHRIPTLSLPYVFETELANIPAMIPYIFADVERSRILGERLRECAGLKVGVVWRGNPGHSNDRNRSMEAMMMASLLKVAGVSLVNLQLGVSYIENILFAGRANWLDITSELLDFADTAALVTHLDLVITVDTSVAHLAGALGRPVWVLLPFVADWRWMVGREDSPWYPSMRLFRQPTMGDWATMMLGVREKLEKVARGELPVVWPVTA
ncbi:MAG: tetratricopeptide repeat protein [Magnetococcales bacterium]|nr:tetratricopeptide repeat protein [Magnetococcales bacterium]